MITNGRVCYNDVGKTATSFVLAQLNLLCTDVGVKRHAVITKDTMNNCDLIFSSFRNPFHYYVSIFNYETRDNKAGPLIQSFSSQGKQCRTFDDWISFIFEKNYAWLSKEHQSWKNKPDGIGLLTFRYLAWADVTFFEEKRTFKDVEHWYREHYFDKGSKFEFIGQNDMSNDFADLILKYSDSFILKPDWKNINEKIRTHSKWDRPEDTGKGYKVFDHNYANFYDQKKIDLIRRGDYILLDEYNIDFV